MSNMFAYTGLVTKIRAMQAKMISPKEFYEIAELKNVGEIIQYLKRQPSYADTFAGVDENKTHRADVEKLLTLSLYADYVKLFRFCSLNQRAFLKLYSTRYEVDLIKSCFRTSFGSRDTSFDLSYKKPFFDSYTDLNVDELAACESSDELIGALRNTQYYDCLKRFLSDPDATLFDYNLALDLYHYKTVWKLKNKVLSGEDLEVFTMDYGLRIDMLNIQWIYRAKEYYTLSAADIYGIIIPIHYKLRSEQFSALVEAGSVEEFSQILKDTYYGKHYQSLLTGSPENVLEGVIRHIYLRDYSRHPNSVASMNTYLFRKELEATLLIHSIECVRYGLNPKNILERILEKTETITNIGGASA